MDQLHAVIKLLSGHSLDEEILVLCACVCSLYVDYELAIDINCE